MWWKKNKLNPDGPNLVRLGKGIAVRQAVDNIGWSDIGGGLLVVDALEQPHLEQEVLKAMADTVPDQPVRFVLNTHTHYDHIALNPLFKSRFGAAVVNRESEDIPLEGRWFEGAGRRVLMRPMPGCHTDMDCIVWFPDDSVLFVGDIFGWGLIPWDGNLRPDKRQLIRDTYKELIAYGAEHVVPGHGPLCTTAELERWLQYFDQLCEAALAGYERGLAGTRLRAKLAPPEDMADWWRFLAWKHDDSVKKVVKAVESGWL
jgi:cyclase